VEQDLNIVEMDIMVTKVMVLAEQQDVDQEIVVQDLVFVEIHLNIVPE
jgi:hypothetical protein